MGKIINSALILIFAFFSTFAVLTLSLSLWFILGLALIIVVSLAIDKIYGISAIIGIIFAFVFWIGGILSGIVNTISGPFESFLKWLGLTIILKIMGC